MNTTQLIAELEQRFELEELTDLCTSLLGLAPTDVGGTARIGSFARALVLRAASLDAVEALADAIAARRPELAPALAGLRGSGFHTDEALSVGECLGPYRVLERLGESTLAIDYLVQGAEPGQVATPADEEATGQRNLAELTGNLELAELGLHTGKQRRLSVLRADATLDRRGLQRFLAVSRVSGEVAHPALPRRVVAGPLEGRIVVVHDHFEGATLGEWITMHGARSFDSIRWIINATLDALLALHQSQSAHGLLTKELLLVSDGPRRAPSVMLLGAGSSFLLSSVPGWGRDRLDLLCEGLAPEQIQGQVPDARSDLYAVGALAFELVSGRPPFQGRGADGVLERLIEDAPSLLRTAPPGAVSPAIAELIAALLERNPERRPRNVQELLEALDRASRRQKLPEEYTIGAAEVDQRLDALLQNPASEDLLAAVESAVDQGADPARIASGLVWVAQSLTGPLSQGSQRFQKRLLFRAAIIYETACGDDEQAEACYAQIIELDPSDGPASAALGRTRRRLGKHEALVEMLLERREAASDPRERAQAMAEIGRIYKLELNDPSQALIAFAQAFSEDPLTEAYGSEVERLAGKRSDAWTEVMQLLVDALAGELMLDARVALLVRLGEWYTGQLGRPDLGLPCFQQVIPLDPSNVRALQGMSGIYRQARQWPELGMVLTALADAARAPSEARDYRAAAAELLATQMNDHESARKLFEQVLEEDPHHPGACAGLDGLYASLGRHSERLVLFERRLLLATSSEQLELNLRVAELCEFELRNPERALLAYEAVLKLNPGHVDALKGADRLYALLERWSELLRNLEAQLRVAVTPRQKITLWLRTAAIHGEEFVDHGRAADAFENVLDLEPNHEEALVGLVRHYSALERWGDVAIVYERRLEAATGKRARVELGLTLAQILAEKAMVSDRAMFAYEQVLELDPDNTVALEALAILRAESGDSHQALQAVEALAKNATSPEDRARHYVSAARMLEERGDGELALSRYELALQAQPTLAPVLAQLEAAYLAQGDLDSALSLYERALEHVDAAHEKAALRARCAEILWEHAADAGRAFAEARRASDLDRHNLAALGVLARISHSRGNHKEAVELLASLLARANQLSPATQSDYVARYAESLAATGAVERALAEAERLLKLTERTPTALRFTADLNLAHGSARHALELYWEILHAPEQKLDPDERAELLYRVGESARRSSDLETAETQLLAALSVNPEEHRALRALAEVHAARSNWQAQLSTLYQLLECVPEEAQVDVLVQLGDIASERLGDNDYATKNYLSALGRRPGDRGLLLKLMRLYSEGKDWERLVAVIIDLSALVEDPKLRAKYLTTAAAVCKDELADLDRASQLYAQIINLDPSLDSAVDRALEVMRARGDLEGVKELLKEQLKRASERREQPRMLELMDELATLYDQHFDRLEQAIAVTQAALELEPDALLRRERLARFYARDPARYLDKALAAHAEVLAADPYRVTVYRSLFELYSRQRDSDSTWCVSQALYALNQASPDEASYFRQGRPGEPPTLSHSVSTEAWLSTLMHPDADRLLTGVLSLLQATVLEVRGTPLSEFGYTEEHRVVPGAPLAAAYALTHDAQVLGVTLPGLYENSNDPRSLSLLHATPPALSLGQGALKLRARDRTFAFEAARALTYFRPGFYVRHVVSSHKELRAWLSGAIRLFAPRFPVSAEIADAAQGAGIALERTLSPERKAALAQLVEELLTQAAALDLRRWMRGIDLSADRAGFVLCDDLPTALQHVRSAEDPEDLVTRAERSKELVRFSVSPEYFRLRTEIGLRRG